MVDGASNDEESGPARSSRNRSHQVGCDLVEECQGHSEHLVTLDLHPIDRLVRNCSNSNVLAMELLQSCTKPSIRYTYYTRSLILLCNS